MFRVCTGLARRDGKVAEQGVSAIGITSTNFPSFQQMEETVFHKLEGTWSRW